jgi:hypothetical protein
MMSAQKGIGTELKKMAPILEPKFPNDSLQAVQIFQSYAGSPFLAVRKTTCGVGFHSIESDSRRSKTAHFREVQRRFKDLSMLRRTRFDGNFIIETFVPRVESIVTAIVQVFIAIVFGLLYKVER